MHLTVESATYIFHRCTFFHITPSRILPGAKPGKDQISWELC